MRLRLRRFTPRTGVREHRVVQPRHPLRHTSLRAPAPIGPLMGDHDGLSRLAGLFSLAAHSRRTVVHVPLRDGVPPDEGIGELVDLVLVHHSYGLRPSMWPALRRSLGPGTPLTVRTDEARTDRDAAAVRERPWWADRRDELLHVTHARSLFLHGGREAFADAAVSLAYAAGQGSREKGAAEGRAAYVTGLARLAQGPGGGHPYEVMVCFKPYPPYAHFKRPGR